MKREAAAAAMTGMMTPLPGTLQARATATGIPDRSRTCGIVFDPDSPPGPDGVDPGWQAVAGLPGLWASHGIDVDHRRFVAVLHAATTELALDAAAYEQRHPGRATRNIAPMRDLLAKRVVFVASRQPIWPSGPSIPTPSGLPCGSARPRT